MTTLSDALRAGRSGAPPASKGVPPSAIVVGGGGALGSAVLERLLGGGRFAPVRVLVTRGFGTAMQGLEPVVAPAAMNDDDENGNGDDGPGQVPARPLADVAVVVFDRERHANGRELAFSRPQPHDLARLAGWLRRRGVRRLLLVLPHAPSSLPEALKAGLANLDEHAVAMLGFEHLVIVRSAQTPHGVRATRWLQRLGAWAAEIVTRAEASQGQRRGAGEAVW